MKHIEINLGLSCNNKCIFCMSGIAKEKLSGFEKKEILEKEIYSLAQKGYDSIGFLGGEPTIHQNFLSLLLHAKERGFQNIEVISNASTFHNKIFLIQSIRNGLTRISLSIHSHIPEKEEFLTGGILGIFEKKMQSLENILEAYRNGFLKKEVSVNIVISKENYKEIKETILFLYKKGVQSFRINFIQLEGASIKNYATVALKYEDFLSYLKEILNLSKQYSDLRINFESIPWCFSGLNYKDFSYFSERKIDKEKDKLSRNDIDFISRDIINQENDRKRVKDYIPKCNYCFLKGECEGIWKRYIDYFLKP